MSGTMTFVNPTEHTLNLASLGLGTVPPKGEIELPLFLCAPTLTDNGNRGKSPIECVAPQLKPKNTEDASLWNKVPAPPTPTSRVVSVSPRQASEAPGVKALREQKEAQAQRQADAKATMEALEAAKKLPVVVK